MYNCYSNWFIDRHYVHVFPYLLFGRRIVRGDPAFLAGAIVSGAIFGDNLAPISDTTIISAGTQEYTKKKGHAEVGGAVASRFKYSFVAGILLLFCSGFSADGTVGTIPADTLVRI